VSRAYKTPSYLVQQLFSQFQGKVVASTAVEFKDVGDVHNELVAASTTCQDAKCTKVAVKVISPRCLEGEGKARYSESRLLAQERSEKVVLAGNRTRALDEVNENEDSLVTNVITGKRKSKSKSHPIYPLTF
jgi:hypothetical protein